MDENKGRRMRQMREAAREVMNVEGEPEAQGSGEEEWMTAWDDVKNRQLDPRMVLKARQEEIEYIHKMKLYKKRSRRASVRRLQGRLQLLRNGSIRTRKTKSIHYTVAGW